MYTDKEINGEKRNYLKSLNGIMYSILIVRVNNEYCSRF